MCLKIHIIIAEDSKINIIDKQEDYNFITLQSLLCLWSQLPLKYAETEIRKK